MRWRSFGRLALALLLVACGLAPVACAASGCDRSLVVMGNWGAGEAAAFQRVLAEFDTETGCTASYVGSQSLDQELQADVQAGDPPDVAMLASPGEFASYAQEGALYPFTLGGGEAANYPPQWRSLERQLRPSNAKGDSQYAFVFKADLKSAVWYDPKAMLRLGPVWSGAPATWPQLAALTSSIGAATGVSPWCLGMEATPNSGWPGTDWIEDILLHKYGVTTYQDWVNGDLPWRSPQVRDAWLTWRSIITAGPAAAQGHAAALVTYYADAGAPMFQTPPGCYFDHKASFIMGNYQDDPPSPGGQAPRPGTDYDFFPFPAFPGGPGNAYEVSADFATLFRPSNAALELMRFLASDAAQRIWPDVPTESAFSVDRTADPSYSDAVKQRVAAILTQGGTVLCFDASDLMPSALSLAFNDDVLRFLIDPGSLDSLLAQLDGMTRPGSVRFHCGQG